MSAPLPAPIRDEIAAHLKAATTYVMLAADYRAMAKQFPHRRQHLRSEAARLTKLAAWSRVTARNLRRNEW